MPRIRRWPSAVMTSIHARTVSRIAGIRSGNRLAPCNGVPAFTRGSSGASSAPK